MNRIGTAFLIPLTTLAVTIGIAVVVGVILLQVRALMHSSMPHGWESYGPTGVALLLVLLVTGLGFMKDGGRSMA